MQKKLTIKSDEGIQAGSAQLLVQVAGKFSSAIWIEQGSKRVNAKSIMGVLSLRLRRGDSFFITAVGSDEAAAMEAVTRLIENGEAGV